MPSDLLDWLNSPALVLWATPMSVAEVLGFLTGILCVWLAARNHIWNFPFGIANNLLLMLLFFRGRLFADAALQVMFMALALRGWWQWAQHGTQPPRPISQLDITQLRVPILCSLLAIPVMTLALTLAKGSVPVFDASITALSVVAQWLLNRRVLQNWWWWIAVDVISIPVYLYKGLYLIALLYAVFLVLCIHGYRIWRANLQISPSTQAVIA